MSDSPFEVTLDEALTLLVHGHPLAEIVARYPAHSKELRELLRLPALFNAEKEQLVPSRELMHQVIAVLPRPLVSKDDTSSKPVKPKPSRPSLFSRLTFFITEQGLLLRGIIIAIFVLFIIGGIILFKQLNS